MQRIRTEILPGVWLTALRTEKFKTAWLSVNLLTQLRRETAACTAVLPYVLRRGCTRLPDLEAIAAELDGLYGAHITPVVHKLGEIQAVGFEADFADDGALGEEIFPRLAADVADLLLHPNTRGGLLRPDIVDSERTQLIARIRAAVNNKRSYARERLYTHMCCCEDFAVPRLGEETDAERIHYRKLTMRYHDLLSTSPVEIFYCGSIDGKRVARILTDVLATMPRHGHPHERARGAAALCDRDAPGRAGAARRGLSPRHMHGRPRPAGTVRFERALRRLRDVETVFEPA